MPLSLSQVMVGDHPCQVVNSTATEIFCQLHTDSGAEIGVPLPVTVGVKGLGTAINTALSELDRRFVVLPVVDSMSPSSGSTTGHTHLTVTGSGFTQQNLAVTVDGLPCAILEANYTRIVCRTSPSNTSPRSGPVVVRVGAIASSCQGNCTYTYLSSLAPQVYNINPNTVTGNLTTVLVNGTGFGRDAANVFVHAAGVNLQVTGVTYSTITLSVGPLPAGSHPLTVVVTTRGLAVSNGVTLTSKVTATLSPAEGSTAGGTPLTLTGNGFLAGNTTVTIAGAPCRITEVMPGRVLCLTPPHAAGSVQVIVQVLQVQYPVLTFNYSQAHTPRLSSVSPATGTNSYRTVSKNIYSFFLV